MKRLGKSRAEKLDAIETIIALNLVDLVDAINDTKDAYLSLRHKIAVLILKELE